MKTTGSNSQAHKLQRFLAEYVLFPFLLAIVPILHIYVFNAEQLSFVEILIPMAISIGFTLVSFIILRRLLKNSREAGMIVSLFLVLFYAFGYFADFVNASQVVSMALWWPVFGMVFIAGLLLIVKYRERLRNLTIILNVVAASLMLLLLLNLLLGVNLSGQPIDKHLEANDISKEMRKASSKSTSSSELPDIYYIIPDAYASNKVLHDYLDYDNSDFTNWLERKGFYVAYDSHSNYSNTSYALASSLNLEYLDFLRSGRYPSLRPVLRMSDQNTLAQFLKSRGYTYAFIGSEFHSVKSSRHADIAYPEKTLINRELLQTMLGTTALRPLLGKEVQAISRKTVKGAFSRITNIGKEVEGPLFVFAHIPIPHPPYIFDENGNPPKTQRLGLDSYVKQLRYVNKEMKKVVEGILSQSEKPPIIIIQSDHGIGTLYIDIKKKSFSAYELESIFGNLIACYIPGDISKQLYQSISPINLFRIVLNNFLGTHLELLKDRSYLWGLNYAYHWRDVTDRLGGGDTE